jgi:hypothetical protein
MAARTRALLDIEQKLQRNAVHLTAGTSRRELTAPFRP